MIWEIKHKIYRFLIFNLHFCVHQYCRSSTRNILTIQHFSFFYLSTSFYACTIWFSRRHLLNQIKTFPGKKREKEKKRMHNKWSRKWNFQCSETIVRITGKAGLLCLNCLNGLIDRVKVHINPLGVILFPYVTE